MGLFDSWKRAAALTAAAPSPVRTDIASPFSEGQLEKIVWSDVFGTMPTIVTRAEALAIPAVHKARSVIISLLADKPLIAFRDRPTGPERLDPQPAWTRRTNGPASPWHRMAYTIDDLIFYGWSLWTVKRGAAGQLIDGERVPIGMWRFAEDGHRRVVEIIDPATGLFRPADDGEVLLIPGPSEGLLAYASRSLGGAVAVEKAWVERARHPFMVDLHQTQESNLTQSEVDQLVRDWATARENSGTAFTPYDVQATDLGANVDSGLYVEARNASRIDIANFFAMPAALLDGSLSTASLTYSTQEGRANEVLAYTVPYWARGIEGRLSQDDVVPNGQFVRFDLTALASVEQSPIGDPGNE